MIYQIVMKALKYSLIIILKRTNGDNSYPETVVIEVMSDVNGKFYIEYDGDKDYDFFLKPEKEGYSYKWRDLDYSPIDNTDPGYIIDGGFNMDKIEE